MAKSQQQRGIPTKLSKEQFEQFILPHLTRGSRGPMTTLSFHAIFNYILCALYLGCQWKHLPIEKDQYGRREIHPTSIYRIFRPSFTFSNSRNPHQCWVSAIFWGYHVAM